MGVPFLERYFPTETSNELVQITNELTSAGSGESYNHTPHADGREKLRQVLRVLYGLHSHATNTPPMNTDLRDAPLRQFMEARGEYSENLLYVGHSANFRFDLITRESQLRPMDQWSVYSRDSIRQKQQNVDIIYDASKVTAQEVYDIQRLKAGKRILNYSENYKKRLEQLSSYVCVRGEIDQHFLMDANATGLSEAPRCNVIYYATFPKLQAARTVSNDLNKFCTKPITEPSNRGTWSIIDSNGLKQKYKDVLRLQIMMAARHGEALDVVTPNAFLSALNEAHQDLARQLFAQAVAELSQEMNLNEPAYSGFKGLFVHRLDRKEGIEDPFSNSLRGLLQQNPPKFPVVIHSGSSFGPQLAARQLGLSHAVACCVMGEGCGPVSHAALTPTAHEAMEENLERVSAELALVFGPQWNEKLLDRNNYVASSTLSNESVALNMATIDVQSMVASENRERLLSAVNQFFGVTLNNSTARVNHHQNHSIYNRELIELSFSSETFAHKISSVFARRQLPMVKEPYVYNAYWRVLLTPEQLDVIYKAYDPHLQVNQQPQLQVSEEQRRQDQLMLLERRRREVELQLQLNRERVRQEEQQRLEQQRREEQRRLEEQQRREEQRRLEEQRREQQRLLEQQQREEQRRREDQQRLERQRQEEQRRQVEERQQAVLRQNELKRMFITSDFSPVHPNEVRQILEAIQTFVCYVSDQLPADGAASPIFEMLEIASQLNPLVRQGNTPPQQQVLLNLMQHVDTQLNNTPLWTQDVATFWDRLAALIARAIEVLSFNQLHFFADSSRRVAFDDARDLIRGFESP